MDTHWKLNYYISFLPIDCTHFEPAHFYIHFKQAADISFNLVDYIRFNQVD